MASKKQNCWEFMECGFGPDAGVESCPVVTATEFDKINGGLNGGRYCWSVKNALCQVGSSSLNENEILNCATCAFFRFIREEEGRTLTV